jgi:hypothetical protein
LAQALLNYPYRSCRGCGEQAKQPAKFKHADKKKNSGRTVSMKAAVLHAFDEKLTAKEFVRYEDVADPKISRPMDVIVRIGGAGVCRTDLHIVEGIWRSKVDVKLPYVMGHENAG